LIFCVDLLFDKVVVDLEGGGGRGHFLLFCVRRENEVIVVEVGFKSVLALGFEEGEGEVFF
jgi:hypothetical protein